MEIIVFSVLKKVSPAPASVEPSVFLALYDNVGERPTTGLVVGPAAKNALAAAALTSEASAST